MESRTLKLVGHCRASPRQSAVRKFEVESHKNSGRVSTACHPEQRAEVSYPRSALPRTNLSSPGFSPEPLPASECSTTVLGLHSPLLYTTMPQSLRGMAQAAQTILEKKLLCASFRQRGEISRLLLRKGKNQGC